MKKKPNLKLIRQKQRVLRAYIQAHEEWNEYLRQLSGNVFKPEVYKVKHKKLVKAKILEKKFSAKWVSALRGL